ncbi:MAG: N-6 DNA methylase, partial [Acidimicrobiia bacterium]
MDGSLQAARPSHLAAADRTRLGAWYTPASLVASLIDHALVPVLDRVTPGQRLVIVDPACGTGNILRAVAAALEARGWSTEAAQACLYGLDIDAEALAICREHLPAASLIAADGQEYELAADVVVGNPPFLSQMRRRTARSTGGHGYADTAVLFLAHWCGQLKPTGRLAMVQPMSMLAAQDAGTLRRAITDRVTVQQIVAQTRTVFDAAVHTVVVIVDGSQPDASDLPHRSTWSHLIAEQFGMAVPMIDGTEPLLGSVAHATADFRDQFYGLVGSVSDTADGPPLITSGLIGVGTHRWG